MKKFFSVFSIIVLCGYCYIPIAAQRVGQFGKSQPVKAEAAKSKGIRVQVFTDEQNTVIQWKDDSSDPAVGFDVYRLSASGFERITTASILGSMPGSRAEVEPVIERSFSIRGGAPGEVFVVEGFDQTGTRRQSEPSASQFTGDLASISGSDSLTDQSQTGQKVRVLERSALDLPRELKNETMKSVQMPDSVNQLAVAAQGGAKIGIKVNGFYRVTKAELAAAQFDVNTDPDKWQLYANGVEQSILVEPNGDYIEFFGKVVETNESDVNSYFLIAAASAGKRIATAVSRPGGVSISSTNYRAVYDKKQRTNYLWDILNGDAENYWGDLISTNPLNFSFSLTGIDTTASDASVQIKFQGFSLASHSMSISINGNNIGTQTGSGQTPMTGTFIVPVSALIEGTNTLQMTSAVAGDYTLFDRITVSYSRKFVADQNRLDFYTNNYKSTLLTGFTTADIRAFDTTQDGAPVQITDFPIVPNGPTFDAKLAATRGRAMYAVASNGIRQAAFVRQNKPSELAANYRAGKLLIITYGDFYQQAITWAQYRSTRDFPVAVVDVDDIFDEFNYGKSSANSITAFLAFAKANWQVAPDYVLILGDASYDPKGYTGQGYSNLVPAKMVDTLYEETGSDEALADIDHDGLSDMAIGRVPAKVPQDVTNALAKVMAFETPLMQDINRGVVFAYDLPVGWDFEASSHALGDQLPPSVSKAFVGRGDVNSAATLLGEINQGRYIVNYSGHGSTGVWASTGFFGVNSVPQLTNSNSLSLFTMLTCLNGYFINPTADSLAEKLFNAQNGGSVMSWASNGKTTPDIQMIMATRFYQQLSLGNIKRMGDLVRDAKAQVPGGSDVRYSWVLIGDPMLKVTQ
ncbi:MAG TPA: C25 family cysteine peptidase [Pyrinomonadaceae bacterium]|nr:hypothetical protein [Chloracidobacterium sp.]MBL0239121.1 hypothetical protein [Chloracidobacterium sp.]MBP9936303.1 hypothetical protein [Pyrinomonadaceae bacterium]HQX54722.1 C25 family cysteine peptidase [Pyrinomonadaceae bacterium]HQY68068.1 C25 family cysteine peptidase [Pyrinomonadaceae bacterium]